MFKFVYFFGFQDPATPLMEAIIDLHNYIFFYLVMVLIYVFCFLFLIVMTFRNNNYRHYFFSSSDMVRYFPFLKDIDFKYFMTSLNSDVSYSRRSILLLGHVFTHGVYIEIIWTIIPAIILALIASPSFVLLYAMDTVIEPSYTLKVIGGQWYWDYELLIYDFKTFLKATK